MKISAPSTYKFIQTLEVVKPDPLCGPHLLLNMHTHLWLLFASVASLAKGLTIRSTLPPAGPVTCGSDTYTGVDIEAAIDVGGAALETGDVQST